MSMELKEFCRHDPSGMLDVVLSFPSSFKSMLAPLAFEPPSFSNLVISGMGASAIAGDVLSDVLDTCGSPVQVHVNRTPSIPRWVGKDTLVIICSYSGNTWETLLAAEDAISRGLNVVALASGGRLEEIAKERSIPLLRLPGGIQPRAAFPECMSLLLSFIIASKNPLGLHQWIEETHRDLQDVALLLEQDSKDPALALSRTIGSSNPVFYGQGYLKAAARRASCQFNENSKLLSFHGTMPEVGHNEIVGWANCKNDIRPVLMGEGPQVEPVAEVLGSSCIRFPLYGRNPLSKSLASIFIADVASVYSALERGIDPTPVEPIMRLKALMKDSIPK